MKVLSIDDDPFFNRILKKYLQEIKIDAITTTNVHSFFTKALQDPPAMFIIDININAPGDGFNIIEKIRRTDFTTPIVAISSENKYQVITHALEIGADDYITKPLDRSILASKLNHFFSSDEIHANSLLMRQAPKENIPAKIAFELSIEKIDEFGITVSSHHLVTKNSNVDLDIRKLIPEVTSLIRCTATNNTLIGDDDNSHFQTYLEFDFENEELLTLVRAWINANLSTQNNIKK